MTRTRPPSHGGGTGHSETPSTGHNIAVALLRHHAVEKLNALASLVDGLAALGNHTSPLDRQDRARLKDVVNVLRANYILAKKVGRHDLCRQNLEACRGLKGTHPVKAAA